MTRIQNTSGVKLHTGRVKKFSKKLFKLKKNSHYILGGKISEGLFCNRSHSPNKVYRFGGNNMKSPGPFLCQEG